MTCQYAPGVGMTVSFTIDSHSGFSFRLPADWTIARTERYLGELEAVYG